MGPVQNRSFPPLETPQIAVARIMNKGQDAGLSTRMFRIVYNECFLAKNGHGESRPHLPCWSSAE